MIKCPKCGEKLEVNITKQTEEYLDYIEIYLDYVEIEFICINDHNYFVRIREEDIIEV